MSRYHVMLTAAALCLCACATSHTVDDGGDAGRWAFEPLEDEWPDLDVEPMCLASACEFTTPELDVRVGDQFVLGHFVSCAAPGAPYTVFYDGDEDWNVAAFNANEVVEIAGVDLLGGNRDAGVYRLYMYDGLAENIHSITIRVTAGAETDIEARHAAPLPQHAARPDCGEPVEPGVDIATAASL